MADSHTLARPYARALFDLANASGKLEQWSSALSSAALIASNSDVTALIDNPRVDQAAQLSVLTDLIGQAGESYLLNGQDAEGTNFLKLLIENNRVAILPEIAQLFEALKAATENVVEATITTATELSDSQISTLQHALSAKLGQRVTVSTEIDQDLIGGAVIRAGDFVIDGSVRSQLAKLANTLAN